MSKKYIYNYDKTCVICHNIFSTKNYSVKVCSKECTSSLLAAKKRKYTDDQIAKAVEFKLNGASSKEIEKWTTIKKSSQDVIFRERGIKLTDIQKKKSLNRWKNYSPIHDGKKKCGICQEWLNVNMYGLDNNSLSKLSNSCKPCQSKLYVKNSVKIKERAAKYRKNYPEKKVKYSHEYYLKNAEKMIQKSTIWALKNPKKRNEIVNRYGKKTQKQKNARTALYRANKSRATPQWLTEKDKLQIKEMYKNCPPNHHVDHIIPINGENVCGLHIPANLQYLPASENESKSNIFVNEQIVVGTCFQFTKRLETLEYDLADGFPLNPPLSEFILANEQFSLEHSNFIKRYEWLGTNAYRSRYIFTARHNGKLAGVVVIDEPISYSAAPIEIQAQIHRGACAAWTPKNLASKLIMFSCKWMVKNTKKRIFFAFSDFEAGEIGTIYQACNFDYLGKNFGSKGQYIAPDGKKVSGRAFTRTAEFRKWLKKENIESRPEWFKSNKYVKRESIPQEIWDLFKHHAVQERSKCTFEPSLAKGKYALILGNGEKETKKLRKEKFWISLPYPKRDFPL